MFKDKFKIVANLPYNIGTTLIFKWLENNIQNKQQQIYPTSGINNIQYSLTSLNQSFGNNLNRSNSVVKVNSISQRDNQNNQQQTESKTHSVQQIEK